MKYKYCIWQKSTYTPLTSIDYRIVSLFHRDPAARGTLVVRRYNDFFRAFGVSEDNPELLLCTKHIIKNGQMLEQVLIGNGNFKFSIEEWKAIVTTGWDIPENSLQFTNINLKDYVRVQDADSGVISLPPHYVSYDPQVRLDHMSSLSAVEVKSYVKHLYRNKFAGIPGFDELI